MCVCLCARTCVCVCVCVCARVHMIYTQTNIFIFRELQICFKLLVSKQLSSVAPCWALFSSIRVNVYMASPSQGWAFWNIPEIAAFPFFCENPAKYASFTLPLGLGLVGRCTWLREGAILICEAICVICAFLCSIERFVCEFRCIQSVLQCFPDVLSLSLVS